jgi:L-2-amino-thiazoline-4-carboxylic acid hydrolase
VTKPSRDCDAASLHAALADANKARAQLYLAFFRALEARLGRTEAVAVLREATRAWGRWQGAGLAAALPTAGASGGDRFAALVESFVHAPDGGRMFEPAVARCDAAGLDAQMMRCPLKEAWTEAGLAEAEIALFCSIASEADRGALEAAGFAVEIDCWEPGRAGCCALRIRPGKATVPAGA